MMTATIDILVNGEPRAVPQGASLHVASDVPVDLAASWTGTFSRTSDVPLEPPVQAAVPFPDLGTDQAWLARLTWQQPGTTTLCVG